MEHDDHPFGFLATEDSRTYFAKLDIALKSGRHIQNYEPDVSLYGYLETYYAELQNYYETLFQLELGKGSQDHDDYYYLSLREDERGKIPSGMLQEIEGADIILGLLLLKYYHEKYLEIEKILTFDSFLDLLFEPEWKDDFLRLFTKGTEENYNSRDNKKLQSRLRATLGRFEKLGWIRTVEAEESESFVLMPSLGRLETMYGNDIASYFNNANPSKESAL